MPCPPFQGPVWQTVVNKRQRNVPTTQQTLELTKVGFYVLLMFPFMIFFIPFVPICPFIFPISSCSLYLFCIIVDPLAFSVHFMFLLCLFFGPFCSFYVTYRPFMSICPFFSFIWPFLSFCVPFIYIFSSLLLVTVDIQIFLVLQLCMSLPFSLFWSSVFLHFKCVWSSFGMFFFTYISFRFHFHFFLLLLQYVSKPFLNFVFISLIQFLLYISFCLCLQIILSQQKTICMYIAHK